MSITNSLRNASVIFGVLLTATAPMITMAADQAVQQVAAPETKQDELMCETVDRPGSRMKQRICAPSAEWSDARRRIILLRDTPAAGVGPTGDAGMSTAGASYSFQR